MTVERRITVGLTQQDIDGGKRGSLLESPLALAISRAVSDATGKAVKVVVRKGPEKLPILDLRVLDSSMEDAVSYFAAIQGVETKEIEIKEIEIKLPSEAQFFARVFECGPKSGPFANRQGSLVLMQTYAEVVRPFQFGIDVVIEKKPARQTNVRRAA